MHSLFDSTSKAGTFTGTMLTIFANISSPDVLKTALLAAIGAAVSFVVTHVLKVMLRRLRHFK